MGLDMYLRASRYLGNWDHNPAESEERQLHQKIVQLLGVDPDPGSPSLTVDITIGYWRKANAIHKWFVDHTQDGEDKNGSSFVTRDQLIELRDLCTRTLATARVVDGVVNNGTLYSAEHPEGQVQFEPGEVVENVADVAALLPTQSGFFFGSTDYDESYLADLCHTIKILDKALTLPEDAWSFEYEASW